jgi:hypothetical protein
MAGKHWGKCLPRLEGRREQTWDDIGTGCPRWTVNSKATLMEIWTTILIECFNGEEAV